MTKTLLSLTLVAACAASHPTPTTPNMVDPILAVHRAQMIEWLHEYDQAGVYPTDLFGFPLSVFRDQRGVRCPMAELMHRSGRDDLVDSVARTNNTLRLAEVHDGPLYDWMTSSGLTRDEIAMVQGGMSIDQMRYRNDGKFVAAIAGRGEVHGKLETAQIALRDATPQSLPIAAHEQAAAVRATRVAAKTSAASPRSSETTR